MIGKRIEYIIIDRLQSATVLDKILVIQNENVDIASDNYLVQWDDGEIDIIDPMKIRQVH
jgi:hypothetical protein